MSAEFSPVPLLNVLARHGVRFVVIGGFAGILHGAPTVTQDLDICYARDQGNLEGLAAALREIGAKLRGAREPVTFKLDARTIRAGDSFTFSTDLGDIDCLGTPTGTTGYNELSANAATYEIAGQPVAVVSLDDLIRMKRAAGRPKDRIQLEDLGALREERDRRERRRRR